MVEEGTLCFALVTQAAGWKLGVTLPTQSSASLTGWEETCEVAFGDGRGVNVHAARRRWQMDGQCVSPEDFSAWQPC
jgi:hypothetical protein